MKIRAPKLSRRVTCVSAVLAAAAGTLLPGAPASAAAAGLATPWKLVWQKGTAQGNYTVTQPPFGIGRTYAVTGTVAGSGAAECYYVRLTADSLLYDSPRACGASVAAFAVKVTSYTVTPVTLRLCRVVPAGCGPAFPLSGSPVT
jgi:hypothetical protein